MGDEGSDCPQSFSRDNFFVFPPSQGNVGSCDLLVPFYIIFFCTAVILNCLVASGRTQFILTRKLKNASLIKSRRYCGGLGIQQIVTLMQSWATFLNITAIFIIPLAVENPPNHIMVILTGFVCLFYQISSHTWLRKLLRLGAKIIDPKEKLEQFKELDSVLSRQDFFLRVLMTSLSVAIVLQCLCFVIIAPILPSERRWILIGCGLLSYISIASVVAHVYQYQRCKIAIRTISRRVQVERSSASDVQVVIKKFTRHQIILSMLGVPASILFLLWAVSVIPLNAYLTVCVVFFDTATNSSMFFTYALRAKKRRISDRASSSNKRKVSSKANALHSSIKISTKVDENQHNVSGGSKSDRHQSSKGSYVELPTPDQ